MARLAKVFPSDAVKDSMTEKPYRILEPGLIWACSWCHPGETIFGSFPDLRGNKISHGICPKHKAEFMSQLSSIEHLSVRPCSSPIIGAETN